MEALRRQLRERYLDIVTANQLGNTVSVLSGDGLGGFSPAQTLVSGSRLSDVDIGDLNGDGNLEIAASNPPTDEVDVFIGDGQGGFEPRQPFGVPRIFVSSPTALQPRAQKLATAHIAGQSRWVPSGRVPSGRRDCPYSRLSTLL